MRKVGIYGSKEVAGPARKQLLSRIIGHPDVEMYTIASPVGNPARLTELYPVYAGETELTLERVLDLG